MALIVGKYQYVSEENFEEYVKALGQAEVAGPLMNSQPIVEVQKDGDKYTVTVNSSGKTASSTFKINEVYDEFLPSFPKAFKSLTTLDGNKFRTETQLAENLKTIRVYEFTEDGMIVHLSTDMSDVKATRTYKRL